MISTVAGQSWIILGILGTWHEKNVRAFLTVEKTWLETDYTNVAADRIYEVHLGSTVITNKAFKLEQSILDEHK